MELKIYSNYETTQLREEDEETIFIKTEFKEEPCEDVSISETGTDSPCYMVIEPQIDYSNFVNAVELVKESEMTDSHKLNQKSSSKTNSQSIKGQDSSQEKHCLFPYGHEVTGKKIEESEDTSDLSSDELVLGKRKKIFNLPKDHSGAFNCNKRIRCNPVSEETELLVCDFPEPPSCESIQIIPKTQESSSPQCILQNYDDNRNISIIKSPPTTAHEIANNEVLGLLRQIQANQHDIMRNQQIITRDVKYLKQELAEHTEILENLKTSQKSADEELLKIRQFNNILDFEDFCCHLGNDKDFACEVKKSLAVIGGATVIKAIRNVIRQIMSDELATLYSWTGAKGKRALWDSPLHNVAKGALRLSGREVSNEEYKTTFMDFLRKAKDRLKSKK